MKDFFRTIFILLLLVVLGFFGYYAWYHTRNITIGDVVKSIYLDFMESGEKGLPFEDHPGMDASELTDYQWTINYIRDNNVKLNDVEQEVIDGLNDGTLEYVCRGIDSIGASDVITPYYFVYGNGSVYVISIPITASLDVSPMALVAINADTVVAKYRKQVLIKCNNVVSVSLYCGIGNAIEYDLYSKLS